MAYSMLLLVALLSVAPYIWANEHYFYILNNTTWDDARHQCQACFKDLVTITPGNVHLVIQNLTSDYWIGLRRNTSGSMDWSRWANGAPVTYQNWYPGYPVPKKKKKAVPTCPSPTIINEMEQCPTLKKLMTCLNSSDSKSNSYTTSFVNTSPAMALNKTVNTTSQHGSSSTGFATTAPVMSNNATVNSFSSSVYTVASKSTAIYNETDNVTDIYRNSSIDFATNTPTLLNSTSWNVINYSNVTSDFPQPVTEATLDLRENYSTSRVHYENTVSTVTVNESDVYSNSSANFVSSVPQMLGNTSVKDVATSTQPPSINKSDSTATLGLNVNMTANYNTSTTDFVTSVPTILHNSTTSMNNKSSTKDIVTSTQAPLINTFFSTVQPDITLTAGYNTSITDSVTSEPTMLHNSTVNITEKSSTEAFTTFTTAQESSTNTFDSVTSEDSKYTTDFVSSAFTAINDATATTEANDPDEEEYIDDACVALLSFGMWKEIYCYELLPFICYDELVYGSLELSEVNETGVHLRWNEVTGDISHYRVEVGGNINQTYNETGLSKEIEGLDPGMLYTVQVFPVKCGRDLNPLTVSFYTLPMQVSNLSIVKMDNTSVTLTWALPGGPCDFFFVNVSGEKKQKCLKDTECKIDGLYPGKLHHFAVSTVVNSTFGHPSSIEAYTRPSKVVELLFTSKGVSDITASWGKPNSSITEITYYVVLNNSGSSFNVSNYSNQSKTFSNLTAGTRYNLSVSAWVNGTVEGETNTIDVYTYPEGIKNLSLTSTKDTITVNWIPPQGKDYSYIVRSFNPSNNMNESQSNKAPPYKILNLIPAQLYNISVITYMMKDNISSLPVNATIYTKPVQPENVQYVFLDNHAKVTWSPPKNSEGATGIEYNVTYFAPFWNQFGNTITTLNVWNISDIKPGTKYFFNVSVLAGDLESDCVTTNGTSNPNIVSLKVSMLCSSTINLHCLNASILDIVLQRLKNHINNSFNDSVYWNLNNSIYIS